MLEKEWLLFLASFVGLIVYILALLLCARLKKNNARMARHLICYSAGIAVMVMITVSCFFAKKYDLWDAVAWLVLELLTYTSLSFCFFNFYCAHIAALRVILLKLFLIQYPQALDLKKIAEYYSAKNVLDTRLEQLLRSGQIMIRDGRYVIQKRGIVWIGSIFRLLTLVLLKRTPK